MSRVQREADGCSGHTRLLVGVAPLYLAEGTVPPHENLAKLVQLCGGTVSKDGFIFLRVFLLVDVLTNGGIGI